MGNRSGLNVWSWFFGALITLVFVYLFLKIIPSRPSVVYVPVQSPSVVQSVPNVLLPVPQQFKQRESQLVSTVGGGYSGYIEHGGKRYDVYEPAVKSQTFKYRSRADTKNLDVVINGIPFELVLDTGASDVSLSSDAVRTLGIKEFVREQIYNTASGRSVGYIFYASVKLGSFEVRDVECSYVPSSAHNLLGGSFLKHFNYSVDESAGTITFIPK
ncbi:MAG: retropepsin-like aspartic protease [Thermodesulfovibrionales bacterium]|nr:retropepsin-like aspartic protease [Thermodesulfovibrionales bacterium]